MTAASLAPAVIDYLVTTCQASLLLGAAPAPVTVVDGPNVTEDTMANQRLLWIGYDRANPAEVAAATSLDWPNLDQARTDDEQGEITCTAEYWSGSTTIKANRDGCAAIVNAVAALLKGTTASAGPGDTTMGGLVFWSRVPATSWLQQQRDDGATVVCVFKVAYYGRIAAS
jgi:hypothetical protein